jgi:hypothetical protein
MVCIVCAVVVVAIAGGVDHDRGPGAGNILCCSGLKSESMIVDYLTHWQFLLPPPTFLSPSSLFVLPFTAGTMLANQQTVDSRTPHASPIPEGSSRDGGVLSRLSSLHWQ